MNILIYSLWVANFRKDVKLSLLGAGHQTRLNGHFSIIRHVTGDPYFDINGLNVRNYFFRCCNNYSIFCQ